MDDESHPPSSPAWVLKLLEGERGKRLVAAAVAGLSVASSTLRTEAATSAASSTLRAAAAIVESPVFAATASRSLRLAGQILEKREITESLAASTDLIARTLDNRAVEVGMDATLTAVHQSVVGCMGMCSAALHDERILMGAFQVARAAQHVPVPRAIAFAMSARDHPAVSATVSKTEDLARLTLGNQTVQRIGMAGMGVATKVVESEKVKALGMAGMDVATKVVESEKVKALGMAGMDVATKVVENEKVKALGAAGVQAVGVTTEKLGAARKSWAAVSGAAQSGAAQLTSRLCSALPPLRVVPAGDALAEKIASRMDPPVSGMSVLELLDKRPEAREILVQMYLELEEQLRAEEAARKTAEDMVTEIGKVLSAVPSGNEKS